MTAAPDAARALEGMDAPPSATADEVAAVAAAVARHIAEEGDEAEDDGAVEHWVLTGRLRAFGDEDVGRPIWDGTTAPWALAGRHDRF